MSLEEHTVQASVIASLYIQALRQGQSLWFRVISGSMQPTMLIGDTVFIRPTKEKEIQPGDIAAFETPDGLVTHRIVQRLQIGAHTQLLEMSDVDLAANWIEEQVVIGRVILTQSDSRRVNLQHPIAKKCATVTASLRYTFYCWHSKQKLSLTRAVLRKCSRIPVRMGNWWICRSGASHSIVNEESLHVAEE